MIGLPDLVDLVQRPFHRSTPVSIDAVKIFPYPALVAIAVY